MLDLEDLLTTRWENAGAIEAYAQRFRGERRKSPPVAVPASFTATLRPYQQHGVDWLQHLRAHGFGGFLADDMGLGKTAQTIAHIVIEQAEGRLDRPALIVVPTSLVTNWTAELAKFAPHLRVVVLHGLDRHASARELAGSPCGDHHLYGAGPRHRGDEAACLASGGAGRGAGHQEPGCQGHQGGLPARNPPPAVPVRHADREQSAGAVVGIRFPDAGPAGRPQGLCQAFPHADREEERSSRAACS